VTHTDTLHPIYTTNITRHLSLQFGNNQPTSKQSTLTSLSRDPQIEEARNSDTHRYIGRKYDWRSLSDLYKQNRLINSRCTEEHLSQWLV